MAELSLQGLHLLVLWRACVKTELEMRTHNSWQTFPHPPLPPSPPSPIHSVSLENYSRISVCVLVRLGMCVFAFVCVCAQHGIYGGCKCMRSSLGASVTLLLRLFRPRPGLYKTRTWLIEDWLMVYTRPGPGLYKTRSWFR